MINLKMKEINTKYGIIFSRDALIINTHLIKLKPITLVVNASLSLSGCRPSFSNQPDVNVIFNFKDIESVSIYRLDDYPYEKYTESSFDEVEGVYKNDRKRIVLSTYDHVFDVIGKYEVIYE